MEKGLGHGPGVDPIPVPQHPTAATEKLEDLVEGLMGEPEQSTVGNKEKRTEHKK
ncbi:hypothetical protein ACFQ3W_07370 [Paenibacillus puldeungensis]|uniref:Uncharacterized protein n=1 Tax=Paenibacillus puldeungensis TaxID=696536 RepID=A0ABW3RVG5_9BACL